MGHFEHNGRLWEFTTISPTGSDEWHVECLELSDPKGFFGVAVVSAAGSEIRWLSGGTLPIPVVLHWLAQLPEPLEVPSAE